MNDTILIDNYLLCRLAPEKRLLLEARLLVEPELKARLDTQRAVKDIAERYGREQLLRRIRAAEAKVFTQKRFASFQDRIKQLFAL